MRSHLPKLLMLGSLSDYVTVNCRKLHSASDDVYCAVCLVISPLSERTLWRMLERCNFLSRTPALRYSLSNRSRNRRSSHTSSSIAAAKAHTVYMFRDAIIILNICYVFYPATQNPWTVRSMDKLRPRSYGTSSHIRLWSTFWALKSFSAKGLNCKSSEVQLVEGSQSVNLISLVCLGDCHVNS